MRILLVGAGGVGTALARIAARRPFAELVIADYDLGRAQRAAAARDGYQAVQLDARDEQAAVGLLRQHRCDVLMNATDPRFVMPLFRAALQAGTHYLDMAMSLSYPYRQTGVKLGDEQFALAPEWDGAARGVPLPRGRQRLVDGRVRLPGGGLADGGEPGGGAGTDRLGRLVRGRGARPRGIAAAAVPGSADRLRLTVGLRGAHPGVALGAAGNRDQMSARICWSSLVVFATGSAWRQSCSMTSR